MPHGKGILTWLNGQKYTGSFVNGQIEGEGLLNYPKDDARLHYAGAFQKEQQSGIGTMTWRDGQKYEGQWEHGMMSGQGELTKK